MQRVASLGAINTNNITKKKTLLVIGQQNPTRSRVVISQNSGKERKALQYIAAGQAIRPVGEKGLLVWLGMQAPGTLRQTGRAAPQAPSSERQRPAGEGRDREPGTVGPLEGAVIGILRWIGSRGGK